MSPHSFHTIQSSLQTLPLAMLFTSRLMITQKSSVTTSCETSEQEEKKLMSRATEVTTLLKSIQGYEHGGLNE